jgi:hypothetical protein
MKRYVKVIALVATVVCAFIGGIEVGNYRTSKCLNKNFLKSLHTLYASEITGYVTFLELIKAKDYETAQKRQEALLAVGLSSLAPYVNNPPDNPDEGDDKIIEAIKIAKKYREKYTDHQLIPNIENSVKKTLDYVKDK